MAYSVETYDSILAGILRDIRSLLPEADIGTDSDHYVRSAAVAAAIEGIYQRLAWLYRQIFPDTADAAELLRHAANRGLTQKAAVSSTSTIAVSGAPGTELPEGSAIRHITSGQLFLVLTSATLGVDGRATAPVAAQSAGAAQNGLTGSLSLVSPPLGMDATASFTAPTAGGEDQESVQSLLARLLEIMRKPPAGGASYDYERWAKEVEGVADALILPGRRGGGTVDVVITGTTGIPSAEVIADCLSHIQDVCSVIADVWVYAPTIRVVNALVQVDLASGYTLAEVQQAASDAYASLLGTLKPTDQLKRSQLEAMVSNLPGVADRVLVTPASNVDASTDPTQVGWIRPGAITVEAMP